jgi:hypothetical protein
MQMQVQLEQTSSHLAERDKEIKLYRMKIKEMMQGNAGGTYSTNS